jgi:Family of unknown function (DUF5808)
MDKKLPRGTLERLWRNPDNWRGLGIYSCKDDPRLFVPKRIKGLGWSVNFASSWAWPAIIAIVVSASLPVIYLKVYHAPIAAAVFISLWIVALFALCSLMSSTARFEN